MARDRIIEAIGASDEDVAHLRLFMRKAAARLVERWRFKLEPEDRPDVLLLDATTLVGSAALDEAQLAGQRFILIGESPAEGLDASVLAKPFKIDALVDLLNAISQPAPAEESAVPVNLIQHDAYSDLFELDTAVSLSPMIDPSFDIPAADFSRERGFDESERLFRRDNAAERVAEMAKFKLAADTRIEATDGLTERGVARRDPGIYVSSSAPLSPQIAYANQDKGDASSGVRRRLDEYLNGNFLSGPARLVLPGAVPLIVDPKNKLYFAKGSLLAFEPHCIKLTSLADWKILTAAEFTELKQGYSGRSFIELQWLCVFLNSGGRPAQRMDPGGMYRLRRSFELSRDYPKAARVTAAFQRGMRAADVASAVRCEIGEVFDVLNAFDAIGYLERA